jgi:hypothetical protein
LRHGDQPLALGSGRYAVVENPRQLLLVKWTKGMDVDRSVAIEMDGGAMRVRQLQKVMPLPGF